MTESATPDAGKPALPPSESRPWWPVPGLEESARRQPIRRRPVDVRLSPEPPPPPERRRYVGVQFGVMPSVLIDGEWTSLYGFVGASLLSSLGGVLSFSTGLGYTMRIPSRRQWHFDLYALATPMRFLFARLPGHSNALVGLGAGIGFHYTKPNGFTLAIKLPLVGYAVGDTAGVGGLGGFISTRSGRCPCFHAVIVFSDRS